MTAGYPSHNKGFNRTPESSGPAKPGEFGGGVSMAIYFDPRLAIYFDPPCAV